MGRNVSLALSSTGWLGHKSNVNRWLMIATISTISITAKLCPMQIRLPLSNGRYADLGRSLAASPINRVGSKASGSGHQRSSWWMWWITDTSTFGHRPSALAASIMCWPACRIRPASMSRCTRSTLDFDHALRGFRGLKR